MRMSNLLLYYKDSNLVSVHSNLYSIQCGSVGHQLTSLDDEPFSCWQQEVNLVVDEIDDGSIYQEYKFLSRTTGTSTTTS